jgi:O-antigen/teichoic acid export membrane protein
MIAEVSTLKRSAVSALKWNYLGMALRSGSALLIGVVLARLLGPKPFGQVAIGWLIIGFGNLLADFGFSAAIVQSDSLSQDEIRFAFSFQVTSGIALAVCCMAGAGAIARLFHSAEVVPVIRALSLMFPLQALGQTSISLLKRRLAFRAIQIVQIASYLIGYLAIGIPLAYLGFGVWALVVAQLVQTLLASGISYSVAPHVLLPSFRPHRSLLSFGGKVIATNVANWSISNVDSAFVGRIFGVAPLGLYSRAVSLAVTPMNGVVTTLQGVLFAAYSRAQNREDALRRVYLTSVAAMGAALIPPFVVAAVVPSTIIVGLYGDAWVHAVPLFVPLALAMPLHALLALAGPLLWGVGKVERELRVQLISAFIAVAVFAATARVSMVCLAWGVLAVYAIRFLGMTWEVTRHLNVGCSDIVQALRGGATVGLVTGVLVWTSDFFIARFGLPPFSRLVLDVTLTLVSMIAAIAVAPEAVLGPNAILFLQQVRPMMPEVVVRFMPKLRPA